MRTTANTKTERRRVTKTAAVPTNKKADALKKELNTWLCNRTVWNHEDWTNLLADLRGKGFSDLIETQKGQDAIGLYLESNKKYPSC